ncbi:MAG: acyltransferase family protein [Bryobacteraceae bacterium]
MKARHLGFLDGMRGFAALYVLVGHCVIWGGWSRLRLPDPKIAVDVFMILSGYLMVHQWRGRDEGKDQWLTIRKFWLRRFFRIAPVYYLALIAVFLIGHYFAGGYATLQAVNSRLWVPGGPNDATLIHYTLPNLLAHLTFIFGLLPRYHSSTLLPDWSIGLEMQFYLAFPFLLMAWRRVGSLWMWFAIVCIGVAGTRLVAPHFIEPSALPLKLPIFFCGMLLAEAVHLCKFGEGQSRAGVINLVLALVAAAAIRHSIPSVIVAVVCVIALLALGPPQLESARALICYVFENRLARFLGDTSYAVYLVHGFAISLFGGQVLFRNPRFLLLSPGERTLILMAGTILLSYSMGHLLRIAVELPGIALGKKIIAYRERRAARTAKNAEELITC